MRTAIVLAFLTLPLTTLPPPATAQYTVIEMYTDAVLGGCNLWDTETGFHSVYVILEQTTGALGVRFRVEQSQDCTLFYLEDLPEGLYTSGNAIDGLTICFDECVTLADVPRLLVEVRYFGFGTSAECSSLRIKPINPSTSTEVVSCDGTVHSWSGGVVMVNGNTGCPGPCFATAPEPVSAPAREDDDNFCSVVSTDVSTWGAIKALYR